MPHRPSFSALSGSPSDSAAISAGIRPKTDLPADPDGDPATASARDLVIGAGEAARLFDACGPFEPRPQIAAAVSGGPDSLALAWLLQRWLKAQGGKLLALIVDHRLRAGSAEEAAGVSAHLTRLGIANQVLVWGDEVGVATGSQAAAREARYRLLNEACRTAGILHLMLGHHRDDQVETLLQRADSGSGPDGLAGMPAISELSDLRLLRPLLTQPKVRLLATCRTAALSFVEDPSNQDVRFARSRLRARTADLAEAGLEPVLLADLTATAGRLRAATEGRVAALLAEAVSLHPAGFASLEPALVAAPDPLALRALAQVLACVGGGGWPPRAARTQRALESLRARPHRPITLGGCRLLAWEGGWLAVREPRAQISPLAPGRSLHWDGRFAVELRAGAPPGLTVGPLGEAGWLALRTISPALKAVAFPRPVRISLPALFDGDAPLAVPQLAFARTGWDPDLFSCRFRPYRALTKGRFHVPQSVAVDDLGTSFTVA
ncbi:tRNA lysidine(34) synthetase TilS [Algihabitans albus]|uniref:tRNA lysidine(34) synthetase TilS n=1 Tax=Algihabitans albus TaxID=2164067 RepID=UPI0013C35333|nr:tRNA lysidine(34) synthetase TilS [Algihabitans albus]